MNNKVKRAPIKLFICISEVLWFGLRVDCCSCYQTEGRHIITVFVWVSVCVCVSQPVLILINKPVITVAVTGLFTFHLGAAWLKEKWWGGGWKGEVEREKGEGEDREQGWWWWWWWWWWCLDEWNSLLNTITITGSLILNQWSLRGQQRPVSNLMFLSSSSTMRLNRDVAYGGKRDREREQWTDNTTRNG